MAVGEEQAGAPATVRNAQNLASSSAVIRPVLQPAGGEARGRVQTSRLRVAGSYFPSSLVQCEIFSLTEVTRMRLENVSSCIKKQQQVNMDEI